MRRKAMFTVLHKARGVTPTAIESYLELRRSRSLSPRLRATSSGASGFRTGSSLVVSTIFGAGTPLNGETFGVVTS